jgi:hypothetical protein
MTHVQIADNKQEKKRKKLYEGGTGREWPQCLLAAVVVSSGD